MRVRQALIALCGFVTVFCVAPHAEALTARLRFDAAMGTKIPYMTSHNEKAALAWGASYQLLAYVEMFGKFGDAVYADRAVKLIDWVLKQRDDVRKVKDYRGVSAACWRNLHYQPQNQPYCYVVHSGMLTYPMARLIEHLKKHTRVAAGKAYDGSTYTSKAALYLKRIEETIAAHQDQWRNKGSNQGYYIFRNASFMRFKGQAMPLNQQNALGRTLTTLARITKDQKHRDRAARLCAYFKSYTKLQGRGLVWNYWPTPYKSPGEDISHAAINAVFAVECKRAGLSFTSSDLVRIAYALFDNSYLSTTSWKGFMGGGSVNAKYADQIGRWLPVVEAWPPLYGPIRSYYERIHGSRKTLSSSLLLSHGFLAVYEPKRVHHGFYHVDWTTQGSAKQATAYGANLLALPPDPKLPTLVQLRYASTGSIEHQQYDGKRYHTIQKLASTAGAFRTEWFVFDPRWWHPYSRGHGVFQFKDQAFQAGKGIKVTIPKALLPPKISSKASTRATLGQPYKYDADSTASAVGSPPFRWHAIAPPGLTIDPKSGRVAWTPKQAGTVRAEIRLESDVAVVSQRWSITIPAPPKEPKPEPTPEPAPEPSKEPTPELAQEPASPDAAVQEPGVQEPLPPDVPSPDAVSDTAPSDVSPTDHGAPDKGVAPPDASTNDAKDSSDVSAPEPPNDKAGERAQESPGLSDAQRDAAPPVRYKPGCQCQSSQAPIGWSFCILLLFLGLQARARKEG